VSLYTPSGVSQKCSIAAIELDLEARIFPILVPTHPSVVYSRKWMMYGINNTVVQKYAGAGKPRHKSRDTQCLVFNEREEFIE
jgi:hypothetical protein